MHEWEKALHTFLLDWKDRKNVIGAVLTGSYANGTQSKFSDIDVHIILSDKVKWRERGNKYVDDFLIEYTSCPLSEYERNIKAERTLGTFETVHVFLEGKILMDKTGNIHRFKKKCNRVMKSPVPRPSARWIGLQKYELWDSLDTLYDLDNRKSPDFPHVYGMILAGVMNTYCQFYGFGPFPPYRWNQLLSSAAYRKKYHFRPLPKKFNSLFLSAVKAKTVKQQLLAAKELIEFVLEKMGGFSIDGWKLRSNIEK